MEYRNDYNMHANLQLLAILSKANEAVAINKSQVHDK